MSNVLLGYPDIASLGIEPYVIDFKGTLPGQFTYTRPTTDTVLGPTGQVITRQPNEYVQDFDTLGNALGARVSPGIDTFLWRPAPAVYTLYVEANDRTLEVRTVIVGTSGLVLLPSAGKTHIRRIGVNRQLDVDPPPKQPEEPLPPIVSIPTTAQVTEGQSLTVTLEKVGAGACTVSLVVVPGSAGSADYGQLSATTVNFATGDTSKFVTLPVLADNVAEEVENFQVQLVNPQGCRLGNDILNVTISDVPPAALPVLSIPSALTVKEGESVTIRITKTGVGACSAIMETRAIAPTHFADDYFGLVPTRFEFAENDTFKEWVLQTKSDNLVEGDEQTRVNLLEPIGCTLANSQCIVTIKDATTPSDPPPVSGYTIEASYNDDNDGGIGKPYFFVDTISDAVTGGTNRGSLRNAAGRDNVLVLSEVQGRTKLGSNLNITDRDNWTYAGFTGPGPHVLYSEPGYIVKIRGIRIAIYDMSHERAYSGPDVTNGTREGPSNGDVFQILGSGSYQPHRIKIVRCFASGGQDEAIQFYNTRDPSSTQNKLGQDRYSVHYSILTNPLDEPTAFDSKHYNNGNWVNNVYKEHARNHGFNTLIGGFITRVDYQRNISANGRQRNPRIASPGLRHLIANNAVVNWGYGGIGFQSEAPGTGGHPSVGDDSLIYEVSVIGNIGVAGPDSTNERYISQWGSNALGTNSKIYMESNYATKGLGATITPVTTLGYAGLENNNTTGKHKAGFALSSSRQDDLTAVKAFSSMEEGLAILEAACGPFPKWRKANPGVLKGVEQAIDQMMGRVRGKIVNDHSEGPGFSNPSFVHRPLTGDLAPPPDPANVPQVKAWLKWMEEKVAYPSIR